MSALFNFRICWEAKDLKRLNFCILTVINEENDSWVSIAISCNSLVITKQLCPALGKVYIAQSLLALPWNEKSLFSWDVQQCHISSDFLHLQYFF